MRIRTIRHFPVHFGRDIMKCRSIEDFEAFSWEGEEAERGRQRIQRVYRQLTLAPALYWSEQNHSDYDYVKNQRSWLNRYLGEALGGELQIHKNGAFFVQDEENRFGSVHPRDAAIPDAALLLCAQLRDQITAASIPAGKMIPFSDPAGISARTGPMPWAVWRWVGPPPAGASAGKAGPGADRLHGGLDAFGGAGRRRCALPRCGKMDRTLSRPVSGRAWRGGWG